MKKGIIAAGILALGLQAHAQVKGDDDGILMQKAAARDSIAIADAVNGWWTASMKDHDKRIAWWRDARFGCFIHWGVYSVPGGEWKGKKVGGYAEHLMRKETIPRAEYAQQLIKPFNPVDFDADAWVKLIRAAGMKYLIITAKHHDGVAMYPTAIGDFSIKQSKFRRDPMMELSNACKKYGIRFGFYYSHAFDWEHPDAPGNDWDYDNPGGDKNLHGGGNWFNQHPELLPKAVKYVDEKSIPQIVELLKKYHPDILWFDTPHKLPLSENIRILKAIRAVDRNVVVNGRLARSASISFGDYKNTADRPAEFYPVDGDWEAIPTTNESYGYSRYDNSHKPPVFFIQLMAKAASRGGNLLMNIGPMGNGQIDPKDTAILHTIGEWMQRNGESIYGTHTAQMPLQNWGVVTEKGKNKYLHVFNWPKDRRLIVNGTEKLRNARTLVGGKPLKAEKIRDQEWLITLPAQPLDPYNSVIVVESDHVDLASMPRVLGTKDYPNRLLAFDAELHGKGFSFGDGKEGKYYVQNWTKMDQWLSWKLRVEEPAAFRVRIRYAVDQQKAANKYRITIGEYTMDVNVKEVNGKGEKTVWDDIRGISLPAGDYSLEIKPLNIADGELMKLLEISLVPVNSTL